MDLITKLGGRKFLMAIAVVGIATFMEAKGGGLTPTMASFLAGIVGMFSVANFASTAKHMDSKAQPGASRPSDTAILEARLGDIQALLHEGVAKPENLQSLLEVLAKLNKDTESLKASTGQIGEAVVNLLRK